MTTIMQQHRRLPNLRLMFGRERWVCTCGANSAVVYGPPPDPAALANDHAIHRRHERTQDELSV